MVLGWRDRMKEQDFRMKSASGSGPGSGRETTSVATADQILKKQQAAANGQAVRNSDGGVA